MMYEHKFKPDWYRGRARGYWVGRKEAGVIRVGETGRSVGAYCCGADWDEFLRGMESGWGDGFIRGWKLCGIGDHIDHPEMPEKTVVGEPDAALCGGDFEKGFHKGWDQGYRDGYQEACEVYIGPVLVDTAYSGYTVDPKDPCEYSDGFIAGRDYGYVVGLHEAEMKMNYLTLLSRENNDAVEYEYSEIRRRSRLAVRRKKW